MNKGDLIEIFKEKLELTPSKAKEAVEYIFGLMSDKLKSGDEVVLPGIGKLIVKDRAARKGHNPKTGETIEIPARKIVKLNTSKEMKEAINKKSDPDFK